VCLSLVFLTINNGYLIKNLFFVVLQTIHLLLVKVFAKVVVDCGDEDSQGGDYEEANWSNDSAQGDKDFGVGIPVIQLKLLEDLCR
jgi:hypothetical protein